MKIITRFVMDMTSGDTLEEESFEYSGPVAECKGPSGGSSGPPDSYYKSMANIAEEQQGMAEEMYNIYRYGQATEPTTKTQYQVDGQWMSKSEAQDALGEEQGNTLFGPPVKTPDLTGLDTRTIDTDKGNFSQFDLEQMKLEANRELLPETTGLKQEQIGLQTDITEARRELLPQQQEVQESYFNEAMSGVDVENWADRAGAEAQRNVTNALGQLERKAQRLGLDPSDQNFQESMQEGGLDLARAKTGARVQARQAAKKENFRRLGQAASSGL